MLLEHSNRGKKSLALDLEGQIGDLRARHRTLRDGCIQSAAVRRKVTVVGAGNVGATVARCIADKELADVVIVDIADQKAAGIALVSFARAS